MSRNFFFLREGTAKSYLVNYRLEIIVNGWRLDLGIML